MEKKSSIHGQDQNGVAGEVCLTTAKSVPTSRGREETRVRILRIYHLSEPTNPAR
jgi:hypothetical protein